MSRWNDQRFASNWDIVSYGLSSAYRINDRFSVGLGMVYTDVSFVSNVTEFLWDDDTAQSLLELVQAGCLGTESLYFRRCRTKPVIGPEHCLETGCRGAAPTGQTCRW